MLYLEDFLELIEPFPQEIRERLTEMREIDLQIQNETDKLDDRIQIFFQQCKKQKTEWKNENYEQIRQEYSKLLENADDKMHIANQLYDLIEKYLKKLDQEIQKFKLELEADHAGITSKLEQVISNTNTSGLVTAPGTSNADLLAIMGDPSIVSGGNLNMNSSFMMGNEAMSATSHRHHSTSSSSSLTVQNLGLANSHAALNADDSDFTLTSNNELMLMTLNNSHNDTAAGPMKHRKQLSSDANKLSQATGPAGLNHNIKEDEDSSSSWNSASQRHDTGLPTTYFHMNRKNSLSNTKKSSGANSNSIRRLLESGVTTNFVNLSGANKRLNSETNVKRHKQVRQKKRIMDLEEDEEDEDEHNVDDDELVADIEESHDGLDMASDLTSDLSDSEANADEDRLKTGARHHHMHPHHPHHRQPNSRHFKEDWSSNDDTNEKYCICKDVSYGNMIMCDNARCDTQWFHFICVGLNSAPKGKWFCPNCMEIKKKRNKEKLSAFLESAGESGSTFTANEPYTPHDNDQRKNSQPTFKFTNPTSSTASSSNFISPNSFSLLNASTSKANSSNDH